jgi:hypothetical protein
MTSHAKRHLALTAALLTLAACGSGETNAAKEATNAAPANEAAAPANQAAAAAPAAPAAAGALTADYMVGKWSAMREDCSATIEFRKDGTVATPIGEGKWTLAGDKLAFDYGDGSKQPPSTIKVLSADRIEITRGSGGKETEKRC